MGTVCSSLIKLFCPPTPSRLVNAGAALIILAHAIVVLGQLLFSNLFVLVTSLISIIVTAVAWLWPHGTIKILLCFLIVVPAVVFIVQSRTSGLEFASRLGGGLWNLLLGWLVSALLELMQGIVEGVAYFQAFVGLGMVVLAVIAAPDIPEEEEQVEYVDEDPEAEAELEPSNALPLLELKA